MANRQYTVSAVVDSNKLQKSAQTALSTPIKVNVNTSQLSSDFKKISQTAQFNVNATVNGQKIENATKILETWSNDAGKTAQVTKILNQENEQVSQSISKIGEKLTPFAKDMNAVRTETKTYTDELGRTVTESTKFNSAGEQLGATTTRVSENLNKAKTSTKEVGDELQKTSNKVKRFGSDFITTLGKVAKFFVITKIIQTFTQGINEAVQAVKQLDDAMVDYAKVSDLSGEALTNYTDKLGELGKAVYRNKIEMMESATLFKQAGFTDEDSAQLAQMANLYMNIADGEISAGDSASFIISQMKAFNITAEDSIHILDAVNIISNNYAVSSSDLANNISKVSSTLSATGTSFEETLGLMTAITEKTRNASTASRGLKQISSRLTQTLDESSGTGKKLVEIYDELGISLKDENGQIRSTYDILAELSTKWELLSKNQQEYIALTSAGSNQVNNFLALMQNFDTAISATKTALNSSGSAWEENSKRAESLTAKLASLKAEFVNLVTEGGVLNNLLKGLVDFGTNFLKFLNTEAGKSTIILTGLFGVATLLIGAFSKAKVALYSFVTGLSLESATSAVATGATISFTAAVKKLNTEIKKNPILLIASAIISYIALMIQYEKSLDDASNSIDNINEKMEENSEEIKTLKNSISDIESQIAEINRQKLEITDDSQLNLLNLEEESLNRQLAIMQAQLEVQQKQQQESARENLEREYSSADIDVEDFDWTTYGVDGQQHNYILNKSNNFEAYSTLSEQLNQVMSAYLDLEDAKADIIQTNLELSESYEENSSAIEANNQAIINIEDQINSYVEAGLKISGTISDNTAILENGTEVDKEYAESGNEVVDSFLSMINSVSTANSAIGGMVEAEEDAIDETTELVDSASELSDLLKDVSSSYSTLTSAIDEYNSSNGYSFDTMEKLLSIDSSYLDMLQYENGQVSLNEEALRSKIQAQVDESKQIVYNTAIEKLRALAISGVSASLDESTSSLENHTNALQNDIRASVTSYQIDALKAGADQQQVAQVIRDMENQIDVLDKWSESLDTSTSSTGSKASSASSKTTDAYKEEYERRKSDLDHALDMQYISEEDYYKRLYSLNEEFFGESTGVQEKYLDIYQKNEEEIFKGVKGYLKDAIEDYKDYLKEQEQLATDSINNQIDSLNKLKDKKLDSIEKELSALKLQRDIESKYWEDKINAFKRQNEELNNQIKLQEYQEAIAEAKSKKVKIFQNGSFSYGQDESAISEAQQNYYGYSQQLQYENELYSLEQSRDLALAVYDQKISNLETYRDKVQEEYDNQIEQLENQKELVKEQYDGMLEDFLANQESLLNSEFDGVLKEGEIWETRLQQLADYVNQYNDMLKQLGTGSNVSPEKSTVASSTFFIKGARASGDSSIKENGLYQVGENPNNKELIIGSKLNGSLMNLSKGTGVVNSKSTNTLAGILNNLGGLNGFGESISNTTKSVINNFNITANVEDGQGLVDYLQDFSTSMTQRAFT